MKGRERALARLSATSWATPSGATSPAPHTVLRPHPAVTSATVGDNGLTVSLLDTRTDQRHQLNFAASVVWALLDGRAPLAQIIDEVAEAFSLPGETAADHVLQAARQFWDAGLLDGSPEPAVTPEARDGADPPCGCG